MAMTNPARVAGSGAVCLIRWLTVLYLLLGSLLIALPVGVGWGLQQVLLRAGADAVRLENVDFNPLLGTLSLDGLSVLQQGRTILKLGRLAVDVRLRELPQRRLRLSHLAVANLFVAVDQAPDGSVSLGTLTLPPAPPAAAPSATSAADPSSPWEVGLDHLELRQLGFGLDLPGL